MKTKLIDGPSGAIEILVEKPEAQNDQSSVKIVAVVCHPHPLHGGTMQNKVVHTVARAFTDNGMSAVRFNFRGVGQSEGEYDDGIGESADAKSVLSWAKAQFENHKVWLCGFSFGAAVALHVASKRPGLAGVIAVAPPIDYVKLEQAINAPVLVVHGVEDELIDFEKVKNWAGELEPTPKFVAIERAGHFFHGELGSLKTVVTNFVNTKR